jgi:hypothetical protein
MISPDVVAADSGPIELLFVIELEWEAIFTFCELSPTRTLEATVVTIPVDLSRFQGISPLFITGVVLRAFESWHLGRNLVFLWFFHRITRR